MKLIHILLAVVTIAASAPAVAAPIPQHIAVKADDLDLGSTEGQRILKMRIQRAASVVCRSEAVESLPRNIRRERGCIREAQARAEAAMRTLAVVGKLASAKDGWAEELTKLGAKVGDRLRLGGKAAFRQTTQVRSKVRLGTDSKSGKTAIGQNRKICLSGFGAAIRHRSWPIMGGKWSLIFSNDRHANFQSCALVFGVFSAIQKIPARGG